jgi:hypothetical protein
LNAALAANVTLNAQLAAAQANQADPADSAAIDSAIASLLSSAQKLADSTAVNSPSN